MRVLDLDMDFFLTEACPLAKWGERPEENCARVYEDEEVIRFLEEQCGLSKEHPIPGAIFETHDQALDYWTRRVEEGRLTVPFDVDHVDTHSDLAFGKPGPDFVLKAVLSKNPKMRPTTEAYRQGKKLDEANYLLFALAYRWISSLTYVRNPKSHRDIPACLLNEDGDIALRSDVSALMEMLNGREPTIPFCVVEDYRMFQGQKYDFVTMAQSPRYAPESADRIMQILRPYLILEPVKEKTKE